MSIFRRLHEYSGRTTAENIVKGGLAAGGVLTASALFSVTITAVLQALPMVQAMLLLGIYALCIANYCSGCYWQLIQTAAMRLQLELVEISASNDNFVAGF